MPKVRLMGGPMMNKVVYITDSVRRGGRYYVAFMERPTRATPLGSDSPTSDVTTKRGYYKPSKNPAVWTFVGNYTPDPYKSYKRKMKKYEREMRKIAEQGYWPGMELPQRPVFRESQ